MIRRLLMALPLLPVAALAQPQPAPVQHQPLPLGQQPWKEESLPPVQQQWQQQGDAPVMSPNAPVAPGAAIPPTSGADQANPGMPPGQQEPATFSRPNIWVPAKEARIQALDKVDAQSSDLAIKVGQSATYGSLTITVKACVVRPSDQPADAAAYLVITDSHSGSSGFSGWMLEKEPSVSMMQSPIYDVRVAGCA
ncbi:MAG TPA: DUF2155 domain-containing protein [Rhodopila sp.]|nr:DUF2155 domain-containing protein [Rhodopila sp.]